MDQAVYVSAQGELRGEKPMARAIRVRVGCQYAGYIVRTADGYTAGHQTKPLAKCAETSHQTADQALRRILRSGFARHLGAAADSRVYWSDKAKRIAR
jgi:hypothetical protein